MARRNATQNNTVETEATEPKVSDTESTEQNGQVEGDQVEGGTVSAEGAPETTKAKTEPDLTEFKSVVEAAVEERDVDTGSLPLASTDAAGTAYRKLDGQKAKNAAKAWVEDSIRDSIAGENASMQKARAFVEIRNALASATASKLTAPKEQVDPTVAYANQLASLSLAQRIVGNAVPDGVDTEKANEQADQLVESLSEQVEQYLTWQRSDAEDKGDSPEVSPIVKAAFKLATGKAAGRVSGGSKSTGGSTYDGPRRDIEKHIREAFAEHEVGTFLKASEISKFKSSEYPEGNASQGAVTARLFDKEGNPRSFNGFEGVNADESNPKGARKTEAQAA